MIEFILGVILGTIFGLFITCACVLAKKGDGDER